MMWNPSAKQYLLRGELVVDEEEAEDQRHGRGVIEGNGGLDTSDLGELLCGWECEKNSLQGSELSACGGGKRINSA